MLKLDIDHQHRIHRFVLQKLLYSLPLPFFLRISSGGDGLHVKCPLLGDDDFRRIQYDDRMRQKLDENRRQAGMPISNLLWDVKQGRQAHGWYRVSAQHEIEDVLDAIRAPNVYIHART